MSIFISYDRMDQTWADELKTWLKPLERQNLIKIWDETTIKPGAVRGEVMTRYLTEAKAAVLLVTQDYLASDPIEKNQLLPLLEKAEKRGMKILWIAVRWSTVDDSKIAKYGPLNDPNRPLEALTESERNQVYRQIVEKIKDLVKQGEPMETYVDFDLSISPAGHAVASSPEGQAVADLPTVPPEDINLTLKLIELRQSTDELLKRFGQSLYQIGFSLARSTPTSSKLKLLPEAGRPNCA